MSQTVRSSTSRNLKKVTDCSNCLPRLALLNTPGKLARMGDESEQKQASPHSSTILTPALPARRYCECFASGRYCDSCNCVNCCNNHEHETTRQAAVEGILERNPNAFRPKIQASVSIGEAHIQLLFLFMSVRLYKKQLK